MNYKHIQGIFLIVGTAIGAGILALPISTAACGFWGALAALLITWFFMTFAALNMVRARLSIQGDADLATMTTQLLGKSFNLIVEVCFLCLLMALVSMYITVGSAWMIELAKTYLSIDLPIKGAQVGFTFVIASIIYSGLVNLANVNQLITIAKVFFLGMIIAIALPDVNVVHLNTHNLNALPATFSMLVTTFGFSIVLPSLSGYLHNDRRNLYRVLLIGSLFIIVAYVAWELVAFGVIGPQGLMNIASAEDKGTGVIQSLSSLLDNPSFHKYGFGIMITAVLTSFLGVGHSLFSYLKDMIPMKKGIPKSILSILLGFIPPLLIINIYPAGIASILSFAGIFVAFILGLIPTWMVLSKEYQKRMPTLSKLDKLAAYGSVLFFSIIIITEILKTFGLNVF